jgi:hypothetical protein
MNDDNGAAIPTALSGGTAAAGARGSAPHPEAVALLIRRARSAGALIGFAVAFYASIQLGYGSAEALLRGVAAGTASAVAVWAVAVAFAAWLRAEMLSVLPRVETPRAEGGEA